MSKHPFVHVELSTTNQQQSAEFYSNVFGWQARHIPEMNYTTFSIGENQMGGGFNPAPDNMPVGSTAVYIGTDDIEATLAQIEAHGGKTISPKAEIPGMGWFALFQDPSGNLLGLYTDMMA